MRTIVLLLLSNVFMTIAWYGHLRHQHVPLWKAILVSWLIAFVEYCFMIPANRIGYATGYNAFQLKMIQEVITLVIFTLFAVMYLKEPFNWRYVGSFILLLGAVYLTFKK